MPGANEVAELRAARLLLLPSSMSNELTTIDPANLDTITGGAGVVQKIVEGGRQLWNAGTVALGILNPTHTPPPRIPNPPRIERPAPVLPGPRTGGGGPTPPTP